MLVRTKLLARSTSQNDPNGMSAPQQRVTNWKQQESDQETTGLIAVIRPDNPQLTSNKKGNTPMDEELSDLELLEGNTALVVVEPSSEASGWWDVWVPDSTGGLDHVAYWGTWHEDGLDELHERGEVEIMHSTGTTLWGD